MPRRRVVPLKSDAEIGSKAGFVQALHQIIIITVIITATLICEWITR